MLRFILICSYIFFAGGYSVVNPGPKYPPTKGEVWPKPKYEKKNITYYSMAPSHFNIEMSTDTCDLVADAVVRYSGVLQQFGPRRRRVGRRHRASSAYAGAVAGLKVQLVGPCEEYPYFGMDESYNLTVAKNSTLRSKSVWGIIRGLETFVQLFYLSSDRQGVLINSTVIKDAPRYQHRGLLLDTSRHFISVANILRTLDAMAINKMNVFHWHIVDDQSFPYQSEKFPEISEQGAFDSSMVYTREDMERVVRHARGLGIRVVPEFDVPGHTRSWGNAYPELLTECYVNDNMIGLGPMDPTKNFTYKLLKELFIEVQSWFPDKYFHIGGDEVQLDCWDSNPDLQEYMRLHNLTSRELHALFMRNAIPLLANNSRVIVWQEVFDEGVGLSKDTLVQVWKGQWIEEMVTVLQSGHEVLFSSSWYLDHLNLNWQYMYAADPRQMVMDVSNNETLAKGVVGGEACMWGEMVDDRNVISRVWPRTSAVAERLWSPAESRYSRYEVPDKVYHRIEEHTCRMLRRGVDAEPPTAPGFCVV